MAKDVTYMMVYGTLMRGQVNHGHFCGDALTIEPAVTTGRLYDLPQGYPAMIEADDGQVHGEAMTFPDLTAKLSDFDILEGYRPDNPDHSLYLRRVHPVTLCNSGLTVPAYCYIWRGILPGGAQLLPNGHWTRSHLGVANDTDQSVLLTIVSNDGYCIVSHYRMIG